MIEARFSLVDHHDHAVTEGDFLGRHLLAYFGFTHCRVVCPRALGTLSAALDRLGPQADALAPVYISVDPARDTPEVMRAYLEGRYPRFTGLTGTQDQVAAAKRAFHVFAERRDDPADPDGYAVPHTAIAYLIGPDGRYRTHFPDGAGEEAIASRLAAALGQGG